MERNNVAKRTDRERTDKEEEKTKPMKVQQRVSCIRRYDCNKEVSRELTMN